jgi:hypothetical protein
MTERTDAEFEAFERPYNQIVDMTITVETHPCSYPNCDQPTAYLPHADGGPGAGWRHVDPVADQALSHVGYPMVRVPTEVLAPAELQAGRVVSRAGVPERWEVLARSPLRASRSEVELAFGAGDSKLVRAHDTESWQQQEEPAELNLCAYYRGVGTCSFGCGSGPDPSGPQCHELGAPGRRDVEEWQARGLTSTAPIIQDGLGCSAPDEGDACLPADTHPRSRPSSAAFPPEYLHLRREMLARQQEERAAMAQVHMRESQELTEAWLGRPKEDA